MNPTRKDLGRVCKLNKEVNNYSENLVTCRPRQKFQLKILKYHKSHRFLGYKKVALKYKISFYEKLAKIYLCLFCLFLLSKKLKNK